MFELYNYGEDLSRRNVTISKLSCGCGNETEESLETKLLFNGSNKKAKAKIGPILTEDTARNFEEEIFKSELFKNLNIPRAVQFTYWRNLGKGFSFYDNDGEEHKMVTIHGDKTIYFKYWKINS
ncbi:MAG: hypothetical protein HUJ25_13380 [Crocinitomicaceae bacterium]|nr:hypothetical protein [Crocinitomicaceae bacterium]